MTGLDNTQRTASRTAKLVRANNSFALALFEELCKRPGNLVFSPYGISMLLALAYAGARGATAEQMAAALRFRLPQAQVAPAFAELLELLGLQNGSGSTDLRMATGLWKQAGNPFLPEFVALAAEYYGARVEDLDFQRDPEEARRVVNAWITQKTLGEISDMLAPGAAGDAVGLVSANAVYFKGAWAHPFDSVRTREAPFWVASGETVPVQMMESEHKLEYGSIDEAELLRLPYTGGDLSMFIILPRRSDRVAQAETALTGMSSFKLGWLLDNLYERKVYLSLPRFSLSVPLQLKSALEALGMVDAFQPNSANFAGIDGRERWLYLNRVEHRARVTVDEEGTVAAAATITMTRIMGPPPTFEPVEVRVDRPFLFLIRDRRTESILFMGRVMQPR